ncbi:glycosyltransferase family 2 protein [Oleiagrimonas sp. MCCC 1A03011]|uniref:glycosyltransferase n=1 Tax=Oleiagrimonas sp. MCCC 1A03011 TaxID=1926883 RepID=UPI000DC22B6A|nr:glycosyltransferase family 2 protein [Oleiagrimonas sp. MCCC 1A03011]RAP59383.1 hypothetical protein BTJ49_01580 [Oleiagrimonas sp. MCCC 1A03011]
MKSVPVKVTICIVTCNQRGYISECIQSVLDQVVDASVSILIGDDASEDGTSDIVAKFAAEHPEKVTHLLRSPRMGAFANMRDLIARADGDFIARLDGDDHWLPGKLEKQIAYLRHHPDCAAVYTNALTVDEAGNHVGLFNDIRDRTIDLASMLRNGNFLNNSSVLFRHSGKQAWSECNTQIDYRIHLWQARHGYLALIGEPLTAYRVNAAGSMLAGSNDRVRDLYWEAILSVPRNRISDADFTAGLANFLRMITFRSIRTRNPELLRKWIPVVIAHSPCSRSRTLWLAMLAVAKTALRLTYLGIRRTFQGRRYRILHPC